MKVLAVGFPKTGTKTLTVALRYLGYTVYDFEENSEHLLNDWMEISTTGGTKGDFYRMFKNVDAACDIPTCLFWKEILEAFPEMKMIFTRRENEDVWYRSLAKQIEVVESSYAWKFMLIFSPTGRRLRRFCLHTNRISNFGPSDLPFHRAFGGTNPTFAKMRYRQHNAAVMLEAPKVQILNFNLHDGWEPLCEFLAKPIPNIPFPHKNKGGTIWEENLNASTWTKQVFLEAVIYFSVFIAAFCIGIYFTYTYSNNLWNLRDIFK